MSAARRNYKNGRRGWVAKDDEVVAQFMAGLVSKRTACRLLDCSPSQLDGRKKRLREMRANGRAPRKDLWTPRMVSILCYYWETEWPAEIGRRIGLSGHKVSLKATALKLPPCDRGGRLQPHQRSGDRQLPGMPERFRVPNPDPLLARLKAAYPKGANAPC